jgi:hypothetical protein
MTSPHMDCENKMPEPAITPVNTERRSRWREMTNVFSSTACLRSMTRLLLASPAPIFLLNLLLTSPSLRTTAANNTAWTIVGLVTLCCWIISRALSTSFGRQLPRFDRLTIVEFVVICASAVANGSIIASTTFNSFTYRSLGLQTFAFPLLFLFLGPTVHLGISQVIATQKEAYSGFQFEYGKKIFGICCLGILMVVYTNNTMSYAVVDLGNLDVFVQMATETSITFSCHNASFFALPPRDLLVCPGTLQDDPWCGYTSWDHACWVVAMSPVIQSLHYDMFSILLTVCGIFGASATFFGRGMIKMTPAGGLDPASIRFIGRKPMMLATIALLVAIFITIYHVGRLFLNGTMLSRIRPSDTAFYPESFQYPSSCIGNCDTYLWFFFVANGAICFAMVMIEMMPQFLCIDNRKHHSKLALGSMRKGDLLTSIEKEILIERLDSIIESTGTGSDKFSSSELITGVVTDAAGGLAAYLCIDDTILSRAHGLDAEQAIIDEVTALGNTEVSDLLRYIRIEKTSEKEYANGIRDEGREGIFLEDFLQHPYAKMASLSRAHVIALRLYTTAAYRCINNPLRDRNRVKRKEPHPLPTTVLLISEGIKKLRAVIPEGSSGAGENGGGLTLYRGLKDIYVSRGFANSGGTELAPMSTTSDLRIAAQYSITAGSSLLFKIKVPNALKLGANLQFLSVFPGEAEFLYPPLTYLQPTSRIEELTSEKSGASLTIIEVEPDLSA